MSWDPSQKHLGGDKCILVVIDYFTKWVDIFAVPNQTAPTCAEKIVNKRISRFGTPHSIHSEQGRNYEACIFKERYVASWKYTKPHFGGNPRCDLTERFNRTLVRMIKAYIKDEQTDWDLYLGPTHPRSRRLGDNQTSQGQQRALASEEGAILK